MWYNNDCTYNYGISQHCGVIGAAVHNRCVGFYYVGDYAPEFSTKDHTRDHHPEECWMLVVYGE